MTIDKSRLKALAEAATTGPWYQHGGIKQVLNHDCETVCETCEGEGSCPDAQFIAAANPATILALLREIDELQDTMSLVKDEDLKWKGLREQEAEIKQIKAENEALRKIISESATACGAAVSVKCSLEFMAMLPGEIASVVGRLGQKADCVDDCAHLIRKLVHCRRQLAKDGDMAEKALDYLKRKGLQGSPLRAEVEGVEPALDTPDELAELRRDAQRLDWIDNNYTGHGGGAEFNLRLHLPCDIEEGGLRHAIDASMTKEVCQ